MQLPKNVPCSAGPLLERIDPRFRPVWEHYSPEQQAALSAYFLPHRSQKALLQPTRPRVIKWYCPFAPQKTFPSGHRYCLNVYTGCAHNCLYCYAAGYEPEQAGAKRDFSNLLRKDLEDLERFGVPPAPIHLSNSTDPFQPLELKLGHTKRALEGLLENRERFTTMTLLTKNPGLAAREDYVQMLRALGKISTNHPARTIWETNNNPPLQVEVSLAFWREEARKFWDRNAPSVAERMDGVRALRTAGIPVVLRIDPLFLRSPLPSRGQPSLQDFGLEEAQTLDDLEQLLRFAKEVRARHVVYSVAKIVQSRFRGLSPELAQLRKVYEAVAGPEKLVFRGGSWRLPDAGLTKVTRPFLELCRAHGVIAKFCMTNLVETP